MLFFKAGASYFALVFGTGFVLGAIRVPFLVPRLGERVAELIEMPFMLTAIVLAARYIVRRFALSSSIREGLSVGLLGLALLLSAEALFVVVLQGKSLAQYVASRDPVSGSVFLAMLALFALMPSIIVHARSGHRPSGDNKV